MLKLKHALLASFCLLPLTATETLAATAGVTAAVNQNAKSTPPGGTVRTVVLGANIVQDETIETDGAGLVQILLADGTTFTVGPNSAITIDRFVYDPDANTAQVSATIGRGVFRFIGGRTSKTEGGVQLNTPVGTVGIRGGMADLNFTGAGQIDLLFGNEVTLDGPNGSDRIFQPGYSIVFGANGQPTVIKTPPGSANFIQQALAGRPGQSGGSSQKPDDGKVANSGVPGSNSGSNPPDQQIPPPDLRAIQFATQGLNDPHQVAEHVKQQLPSPGKRGFSAGILFVANPDTGVIGVPLNDHNGSTRVDIGSDGDATGGKMVLGLFGASNVQGSLYEAEIISRVGEYPGASSVTFNLDGEELGSISGVTSTINTSTPPLVYCDCVEWGTWEASFGATVNGDVDQASIRGTWVTGDVMTPDQYQAFDDYSTEYMYGEATFGGTVKGYGQYAEQSTLHDAKLGQGTFTMNWNFGTDSGAFYIDDFTTPDSSLFGNHIFSAYSTVDRNGMADGMFGTAADQGDISDVPLAYFDTEYVNVSGAFVGEGEAVMGSFSGVDSFTNGSDPMFFSVSGVFAGEQTGY